MHALIIEDQALIAMMVEDELCALGFTSFDVATTQQEAIAAAERRCPDLITADDRLTTGSGIDAVRIICAELSIPTVYIVGNPYELRRRLPDTIVVGKPFTANELLEAIQRAAMMVGISLALADFAVPELRGTFCTIP
jgi:CheY-like chemotaxis protein